jgi:hypothetical protein
MTDRGIGLAGAGLTLNVRRLMYQSLIWPLVAGNNSSGLRTSLDPEGRESLPDPLVDRVRRDVKLGRDLL